MSKEKKIVNGFKGFDKNLECRGFKFEEGKEYEHKGDVRPCSSGFHFCANPADVLDYYPLVDRDGNLNRFAKIEASGEVISEKDKSACSKIKIKAELKFPSFVGKLIDFIINACKMPDLEGLKDMGNLSDGGSIAAQIGSSGDGAKIGSSGDGAKIGSSGYGAQIGSSGYGAQIGSSGDGAKIGRSVS